MLHSSCVFGALLRRHDACACDWLRLLASHLCGAGLFAALHDALAGDEAPGGALVALLSLLRDAVDGGGPVPASVAPPCPGLLGMDAAVQSRLVGTAERASDGCLGDAAGTGGDECARATLRAALQLLVSVLGRDPSGPRAEADPSPAPVVALLLRLLGAMPPPGGPRARGAAPAPSAVPYPGFRRDVVAALANGCHGRARVVGLVVSLGGVPALLAQCRGDAEDTFVREWALWAVRNMCEASEQAQAAIREMDRLTEPKMAA